MNKLIWLFCWMATTLAAQARTWESLGVKIEGFDDQTVTALAAANDRIYCATKTRLFIFDPKSSGLEDATERTGKRGEDEITAILVDPVRKEIWIVTNHNTRSAQCYSYELAKVQPEPRSFLNSHLNLLESLQKNAPPGSIETLAYNERRAVVGFFKGKVYLYSLPEKKRQPLYSPANVYHWPTASILTGDSALIATRGDGLIAIDLKTEKTRRFPDKNTASYVRALTIFQGDLYLGAKGLYKIKIKNLVE